MEKDLPMLAQGPAGEIQVHHVERPAQLSLHPAPGKSARSRPDNCSPRRRRRNCGAFTNGPKKPRTAACRISRSSRTRRSGSRFVPSAACARPRSCGHQSDFVKDGGRACFFQRARSRILAADVLVLNHTLVLHATGRSGGGSGRAACCSRTILRSSTRRTRWKGWRRGTSA